MLKNILSQLIKKPLIPMDIVHSQVDLGKSTMGATSGRKLKIYLFSHSVRISSPSVAIEYRGLGNILLSFIHFRLLEHISTTRKPSKFRLVEERRPIGKILSITRCNFDHPKFIQVSTTRREKTYRKDTFDCSM